MTTAPKWFVGNRSRDTRMARSEIYWDWWEHFYGPPIRAFDAINDPLNPLHEDGELGDWGDEPESIFDLCEEHEDDDWLPVDAIGPLPPIDLH